MRLEQFQYLIAVANSKSISVAAENLYISQPALSRAIKSLEEELNVELLFRTVDGVRLTEVSKTLLPHMQEILDQTNTLVMKAQEFTKVCHDPESEGQLTILTLPSIADSLLPSAIETFSNMFPNVSIKVELKDSEKPYEYTIPEGIDMILTLNINNLLDPFITDSGLHCDTLFTDTFSVVLSTSHSLANKKILTASEILNQRLVLHNNNFNEAYFYDALLSPEKKKLNVILKSNNSRVITNTLLKQDAVLITNNLLVQEDYANVPDLKVIPVKSIRGQFVALYDPTHPSSCLIKQFSDILKSVRTPS